MHLYLIAIKVKKVENTLKMLGTWNKQIVTETECVSILGGEGNGK